MLTSDRRALAILANSEDGCTEAFMEENGIKLKRIAELVDAGLATIEAATGQASGKAAEVARIRITDEGRAALARRRPM